MRGVTPLKDQKIFKYFLGHKLIAGSSSSTASPNNTINNIL